MQVKTDLVDASRTTPGNAQRSAADENRADEAAHAERSAADSAGKGNRAFDVRVAGGLLRSRCGQRFADLASMDRLGVRVDFNVGR